MTVLKGVLKDKSGNILHPESEFSKIIDSTDSKTLSTWRTEIDAVAPTTAEKAYLTNANSNGGVAIIDSTTGKISSSILPAALINYLGGFASSSALPATASEGNFALCYDTDTIWVWDAQKLVKEEVPYIAAEDNDGVEQPHEDAVYGAWIDTGKKGAVTSVNEQTGDITITLTTLGITATASTLNGLDERVTNAASAASTAQSTADEIDFAVIENGADVPDGLRDNGIYFEKDAVKG